MFLNDPVSDENFDDNDDSVGIERSTNQKLTFMDNFFLIFIIYIYAAIIINYVLSSDKEKYPLGEFFDLQTIYLCNKIRNS